MVGIDAHRFDAETGKYHVNQYTGDEPHPGDAVGNPRLGGGSAEARGAGEIVLNMMNQDGCATVTTCSSWRRFARCTHVPLIASGGAGTMEHFLEAFRDADVDGALAASVFHKQIINIGELESVPGGTGAWG